MMRIETRCPGCKKKMHLGFFQMCFVYGSTRTWSHQCPGCEGYVRTPWIGEIPIGVSSLILGVGLASEIFRTPRVFVVVPVALLFCYLISGFLRYLFLRMGRLSYQPR
jgi:hypothetical protein